MKAKQLLRVTWNQAKKLDNADEVGQFFSDIGVMALATMRGIYGEEFVQGFLKQATEDKLPEILEPLWKNPDREVAKEVIYQGATIHQILFGVCDDPRELLKPGETYEVESVRHRHWATKIKLTGIVGWFNADCFANGQGKNKL